MKRDRSRRRGAAGKSRDQGFSLLEVLVAFVVLALALGTMTTGVALAMRSDARTRATQGVLRVAQSQLEAAGLSATLEPGQRTGMIGQRYRWRQTTVEVLPSTLRPQPSDAKPDAKPVQSSASLRAFWVTMVVDADDGTRVELAALKVMPERKS